MSDAFAIRRTAAFAALLAMIALGVAALGAAPATGASGAVAAKQKPKPAKAKGLPVAVAGTGIVQTVYARGLIVTELDGRMVRVPVAARTRVLVDGVRASLADVEPGFVATFTGRGKAVRVLRAVDPSPERRSGMATVASVSPNEVVVEPWHRHDLDPRRRTHPRVRRRNEGDDRRRQPWRHRGGRRGSASSAPARGRAPRPAARLASADGRQRPAGRGRGEPRLARAGLSRAGGISRRLGRLRRRRARARWSASPYGWSCSTSRCRTSTGSRCAGGSGPAPRCRS